MVSTFSRRPTRYARAGRRRIFTRLAAAGDRGDQERAGAGAEWAAETRRNLIQDEVLPVSPFFLLVMPDRFYLWRDSAGSLEAVPADYEADGTAILSPYIGDLSAREFPLSNAGLDLAVTFWLRDLVGMRLEELLSSPEYQWLLESGLYEAIRGGRVEVDTGVIVYAESNFIIELA